MILKCSIDGKEFESGVNLQRRPTQDGFRVIYQLELKLDNTLENWDYFSNWAKQVGSGIEPKGYKREILIEPNRYLGCFPIRCEIWFGALYVNLNVDYIEKKK